ncbi:MAG: MarR family transcriptional regulator [Clostridiales bacterium]|nr:MarR family transcriptional regulator [Clostridiales bacterium]
MKRELIGKYIGAIHRHQQVMVNNQLRQYGIGSGQYIFFLTIFKNPGISQKELTELIKIDKATTAKALKKLEEQGYIYRTANEDDKRYNRLYLTEAGIKFQPKLIEILDDITEMISRGINDEQYDEIVKSLKIILDNLLTGTCL